MMYDHRSHVAREHRMISTLIPWYVNDSIGEGERQRVDAHLSVCADCRDDLAFDRQVHQGVTAETAVEYMPAASLKRLQARLDGIDAGATRNAPESHPAAATPSHRATPWHGLMAASVAIMSVALCLLAADRWLQVGARAPQADYYTVTTAVPRAPGEVIRAVFAPNITLDELQAMLDEAQLRIVSGPTEAGVYSLAANSRRPVSSSLALLRAHAKVRFAESSQPGTRPGDTP